ncbi:hypothetical protein DY000_02014282 [Brassica cretica]|uniref:Uncharacterized protein n=1 Tax=Brassica cretica TaxID=69181 RepID=A0ABQ7CQD0_BRACR|nr:hypothetical protein DY000_02014282 [Brassica cretica]
MNGWIGWRVPMNLPMYLTRYMVHAPLTLQLTSAHDRLALSTNVHKLLQLRSPLFLLNRRPIFALLHFGLIRNKYGRWYGPPVREPLALVCLGWDSKGLYLLVGDCNSLSKSRLLTPHSLLFQVTSSELVEVAGH